MSGILGLWDLRGAPLPPEAPAPAMARLRRRGPDGTHVWQAGPVALGHARLDTTPEALEETLPLHHAETGCTITADVRLDDRDTLLAELGCDGSGRVVGDGELVLRAYLRWGEACPERLLGDFAFAIHDQRRRTMFCARDPMGMRQLIYTHRAGDLFAFATDAKALVALDRVPARLNEARVLDFLDQEIEGIDDEVTFFEDVLRLPPASAMVVDGNGLRLRRYWRLEPGPMLHLPSDAAYGEAFEAVFTEAVRCRLRSPATPGAMLSGGMDSGSVAAVASDLLAREGRGPLPTFSGTGSDPARVETRLIAAATGMPGLDPTVIRHDELDALLPVLRARIDDLGEPFDGHMTMIAAVYAMAARAGLKVVLDGVSGDTTLSGGNTRLEAIRAWRLREVLRFARHDALALEDRRVFWTTLMRAAWTRLVPEGIRRRRHALRAQWAERRHVAESLASPWLVAEHDLAGRRARYRARNAREGLDPRQQRAAAMTASYVTVARERYDRVAAEQGIEARDPFCDPRVLAFCLSLPDAQLERDGVQKHVMRVAMAGRLPDAVRWNRVRDHHGYDFTKAVFAAFPDLGHGAFRCADATRRFLREGFEASRLDQGGGDDVARWGQIAFLDAWLRSHLE